jgi:hypothetical protein
MFFAVLFRYRAYFEPSTGVPTAPQLVRYFACRQARRRAQPPVGESPRASARLSSLSHESPFIEQIRHNRDPRARGKLLKKWRSNQPARCGPTGGNRFLLRACSTESLMSNLSEFITDINEADHTSLNVFGAAIGTVADFSSGIGLIADALTLVRQFL